MTKTTITPEDAEEFNRLYTEFLRAAAHAGEVLHKFGMESAQFAEADAASGKIWRRLKEIQGRAGKPWNA
jgi:hypothetical protein